MTVVGVGRKELGNQVTVSGVNLHGIEPGLHSQPHCVSIGFHHLVYVLLVHLSVESGGVEVESAARSYRHLSAGSPVSHISAVSELYARLGPFSVHCISQLFEFRNNLLPHPELGVETDSASANCRISDCSHSYSAFGNCPVVVEKLFCRSVVPAHSLECG